MTTDGMAPDHDEAMRIADRWIDDDWSWLSSEVTTLARAYKDVVRRLDTIADEVPTTWLDPLLTGPKRVVPAARATVFDIENLLREIRARIAARAATTKEATE